MHFGIICPNSLHQSHRNNQENMDDLYAFIRWLGIFPGNGKCTWTLTFNYILFSTFSRCIMNDLWGSLASSSRMGLCLRGNFPNRRENRKITSDHLGAREVFPRYIHSSTFSTQMSLSPGGSLSSWTPGHNNICVVLRKLTPSDLFFWDNLSGKRRDR